MFWPTRHATRQGIAKLMKHVQERGSLERVPGSGRLSKIIPRMEAIIDAQMQQDDEATGTQLKALLHSKDYGLSKSTILRRRSSLGWTRWGSACQMIHDANKVKQLEFAKQYAHEAETGFMDVVLYR